MAAQIIDGKKISKQVRAEVQAGVAAFKARHGRAPGLHVVLVGEDAASQVYVRNKEKASLEVGMLGAAHRLPADTSEAKLLEFVSELDARADVDGILVQLPLPKHLASDPVIDRISAAKDVDGLTEANAGKLALGRPGLRPCTPYGCMRLLEAIGCDPKGLRAVVVGRSNLVGKPIAQLLLQRHATVTLAHSRTRALDEIVREADIVVAAVGVAELVKGDWIRPGAVVLDVGINRGADGKLHGDVDYAPAAERAAWITPVPGGVGPMTIAMLLGNTLEAARRREGEVV